MNPTGQASEINSASNQNMLEMGFRQTQVARMA